MKKLKFNKSIGEKRTKASLELIHTDICGPMEVPTPSGEKYFATFTDDYSHSVSVALLKRKSDVGQELQNYIQEMENQTGKTVKEVRSDNAPEYLTKTLLSYYKQKGIIVNTTNPYTPEQNGIAERMNDTLGCMVRAQLQTSDMKKHW